MYLNLGNNCSVSFGFKWLSWLSHSPNSLLKKVSRFYVKINLGQNLTIIYISKLPKKTGLCPKKFLNVLYDSI